MWAIRFANLVIAALAGALAETNPPDGSLPARVMVGMLFCVVLLFVADLALSSRDNNDEPKSPSQAKCHEHLRP